MRTLATAIKPREATYETIFDLIFWSDLPDPVGLQNLSSPAANDRLVIWDRSASLLKHIDFEDLVTDTSVAGGPGIDISVTTPGLISIDLATNPGLEF